MPQKHSVIVVGQGVSALSSILHLTQQGLKNIAWLRPIHNQLSPSSYLPGFAQAGTYDNITRIIQAHGASFTKAYLAWSQTAYQSLKTSVISHGLTWTEQPTRYRLLVADDEAREAQDAAARFRSLGIESHLSAPSSWPFVTDRVLGIQSEPLPTATFNPKAWFKALLQSLPTDLALYEGDPQTLTETADESTLTYRPSTAPTATAQADQTLNADMIILAEHLDSGTLLPGDEDIFFPLLDQWIEATFNVPNHDQGRYWTAHHGHEWGGILDDPDTARPGRLTLCVGGGRYLRSAEGVDDPNTAPVLSGRVGKFLMQKLQSTFHIAPPLHCVLGQLAVYCRTCDELPAIGPWMGYSRILVANGFQTQSLSLGFQSGIHLADCIMTGQMGGLPDRLHPRRWLSLREVT